MLQATDFAKNRPTVIKKSRLQAHAELFSAFAFNDEVTITLLLPKSANAETVRIVLWLDDSCERKSFELPFSGSEGDFDAFEYRPDFTALCKGADNGLFYFHYEFDSAGKTFFVSRNETDLLPEIINGQGSVSSYQLTVFSPEFRTPDTFKGKIMYQIFPDRFFKGSVPTETRSDAVINGDWYNGIPEYPEKPGDFVRNNMFFGGTLWGIAEKLRYLKSLGVGIIYLNPIFEAYSNHKYDTGDYEKVDDMFGGNTALDKLIAQAETLGIKVILDGVFNHTGSDSIYFNREGRYASVGAYNSRESRYYDWYRFFEYPDKYDCWWGVEILPKANSSNPDYQEFICGADGIISKYIKRGTGGWRLDVADELDESMLRKIRSAAKAADPDSLIIGEVWEDASNKVAYDRRRHYFRGYELDSVMNYPLRNAVLGYLKNRNAEQLAKITAELYSHYPKEASDVMMNFLGTHDTERIITLLGSDADLSRKTNAELSIYKLTEAERIKGKELLQLAYTILSFMPGIPCIYYGDEIGIEGARDPFNRMPYPWGNEDRELLDFFTLIGSLRLKLPVLAKGFYRVRHACGGVFAFERFDDAQSVTVYVNMSDSDILAKFGKNTQNLIDSTVSETFSIKPRTAAIFTDFTL